MANLVNGPSETYLDSMVFKILCIYIAVKITNLATIFPENQKTKQFSFPIMFSICFG